MKLTKSELKTMVSKIVEESLVEENAGNLGTIATKAQVRVIMDQATGFGKHFSLEM